MKMRTSLPFRNGSARVLTFQPSPIRAIVSSYSGPLIKTYSYIRFVILRQTFLEEIDQYLPHKGRILDLGCGFGLFSLYFGATHSTREMVGVDLNERRIEQARRSAAMLGLCNVEFHSGNVLQWRASGTFDAIYMLDVLHHLPDESVSGFLSELKHKLRPGGVLLLKEVADRPLLKMWFTLALDRMMVGFSEPIHYWAPVRLSRLIESMGFEVKRHRMRDFLPYPHILYVCRPVSRAVEGATTRSVSAATEARHQ